MICFRAKTDKKVKEKVTCGSYFKLKNKIKTKTKQIKVGIAEREKQREREIFFIFFFFSHFSLRYTEIEPSEFVRVRTKRLYSTRATRGNQKHGILPSFQLKI